MKLFRFISIIFIFLLLLAGGCMQFEYTGREFAALPAGSYPKFYNSVKTVPAGVYVIMGRAELTASGSDHWEDIQDMLLAEAARRGADAVAVVSKRAKWTALYDDESANDAPSDSKVNPYSLTPDGAEIKVDLAGNPVGLPAEHRARVRIIVRALFYKNKVQFEKIVSDREKQLDQLINKPQALPGSSK